MLKKVDKYNARRRTLGLLTAAVAGTFVAGLPGGALAQSRRQLRIGFQKGGTLIVLKGQGTLDKRLAMRGVDVKWLEFPAGPQLLEGLNVGSIDFGLVGETPPIFAQAAGANLVYVANHPASPHSEAIIVQKNSALKSVANLKGRKVALNRGSNVHYLLVKALEKAGLKYSDIQPVYLAPADARAAFERGSIDAWVIWDPYFAAAQHQLGARILVDGAGLVSNHIFYLSSRPYAEKNADVLRIVVDELAKTDAWGKNNLDEEIAILSSSTGLDRAVSKITVDRQTFGVQPITADILKQQQDIADVFSDLKLIPRHIRIQDAAPPAGI
jgi:sulfonate transport system substrate-binding protein